jgi:N-acetylmuramoyl-L-alanine amidase
MPSKGITPRPNLYVLNKTKMPAILSELGFISNPDELEKMKTVEYREMAAKALAVSIVKYFSDIHKLDFGFDVQSIYNDTIPQVVSN